MKYIVATWALITICGKSSVISFDRGTFQYHRFRIIKFICMYSNILFAYFFTLLCFSVLFLFTAQHVECNGAIFLSKEESHVVLKGGHHALSELEGWEEYYYTNKVSFFLICVHFSAHLKRYLLKSVAH